MNRSPKKRNSTYAQRGQLFQLQNEREKLELEKAKFLHERRFWNKNFGVLLTATISVTAILVTIGQIWITSIQKDKEIEVARIQKQQELELANDVRVDQQKLEVARFLCDKKSDIISEDEKNFSFVEQTVRFSFGEEISAFMSKVRDEFNSPKMGLQDFHVVAFPKKPGGQNKSYRGEVTVSYSFGETEVSGTTKKESKEMPKDMGDKVVQEDKKYKERACMF